MQPPDDYMALFGEIPEEVTFQGLEGELDFIHYFTMAGAQLAADFPRLKQHLDKKGMLWISWPKGKSKISTDLNRDIIRDMGLQTGLVDVKVCSVDEVWSGLKFVWRTKDR